MQEGKTCSSLLEPQKVAQKCRAKSKQAYEFTSLGRPPRVAHIKLDVQPTCVFRNGHLMRLP